jgi:hypothetical protein
MYRLPQTQEFHATSLRAPCLRPLAYKHMYPDVQEPSSPAAVEGTIGHHILTLIHTGKAEFACSAERYAQMFSDIVEENLHALTNPDQGMDLDGTGRASWLEDDLADIRKWAAGAAPDMGEVIMNWCRWWRANISDKGPLDGVVAVETPLSLTLTSAKGSEYHVAGLIDLILETKSGELAILDWKFGSMTRSKLTQAQLEMDFQLCTYALAVRDGEVVVGGEPVSLARTPTVIGLLTMEDLLPYKRKTPIPSPKNSTEARFAWLQGIAKDGATHLQVGDMRGPVLHDAMVNDAVLDLHRSDMMARMAATRTGGALVRVRGEHCSWCFWREECLKEWRTAR